MYVRKDPFVNFEFCSVFPLTTGTTYEYRFHWRWNTLTQSRESIELHDTAPPWNCKENAHCSNILITGSHCNTSTTKPTTTINIPVFNSWIVTPSIPAACRHRPSSVSVETSHLAIDNNLEWQSAIISIKSKTIPTLLPSHATEKNSYRQSRHYDSPPLDHGPM